MYIIHHVKSFISFCKDDVNTIDINVSKNSLATCLYNNITDFSYGGKDGKKEIKNHILAPTCICI